MPDFLVIPVAAIAICLGLGLHQGASAQTYSYLNGSYVLRGEVGSEPEVFDDGVNGQRSAVIDGATLSLDGRFLWQDGGGRQISVSPFLGLEGFPDNSDNNRLRLGLFGEFRTPAPKAGERQFRLRLGYEHASDFSDAQFDRFTLQGTGVFRHGQSRRTVLVLRYRYRDQNEAATFDGFDQNEYLASVTLAWQPAGVFDRVSLTPYLDFRRAEQSRFSYNEYGLRLQGRVKLSDRLTAIGRLRAFQREYRGPFSGALPIEREDTRFAAEVELRRAFGQGRFIFAALGWERNRSNIAARDFSDPTFGLGFQVAF